MSLLMAMAVAIIPASAMGSGETWTVAGDSASIFGSTWAPSNTANDMKYDSVSNVYYKIYTNVPSGSIQFKVCKNHGWDYAYPGNNKSHKVAKSGSVLIITINANTEVHAFSFSTLTVAGSGSHLVNEWDPSASNNNMTYSNGVWTKVYTGVSAGTYEFKIVGDNDWNKAFPYANASYKVEQDNSVVTITLGGNGVNVDVHAHTYTESITTSATCTTTGVKTFRCSCGDTYTETIDKLGHDWDDATCTAPKTCATCGATEGEALGHKWDDNCDTECNVCGDERVAPHNWSSECDELCGDCEATREAPKEHGELDEYVFNATCEEDGYIDYICHDCGDIINTVTLPANHDHDACPHKAVVGDTYYETIQQAIAGATAGSVIVLNNDIEVVGDLTIENQVTINLNGKTLTAGAVVTFFEGTQFIGEGKLEVAKDSLYNIKGETDYVPVWNEAGYYTFSEVKDQIKESTVEDTEVVVFRPAFENKDIKKEFADGATDNGISFVISITWGTGENAVSKEYTLSEELIANVYNAENPKAIQLGFENWQAGVEYTVTLRIVSGGIYYETTLCTMKDGAITVPEIVTE